MKKRVTNYHGLNSIYLSFLLLTFLLTIVLEVKGQSGYLAGDFHQHTTFTDGSFSFGYLHRMNAKFGLDWWANSEHGGCYNRNGLLSGMDLDTNIYWDDEHGITISGYDTSVDGHRLMWRWESLLKYSFPALVQIRKQYPSKTILQGFEMNVPGHEHASVCIVNEQFNTKESHVLPLAELEYTYDDKDFDKTGGSQYKWFKSNEIGHKKAINALRFCQTRFSGSSWFIIAHPERKGMYTIADFRDMNNIAPDVAFGFESMPGHQKSPDRGEYKSASGTYGISTYGGTGIFAAKVGGVWDALLSEGREWWLFSNSDFHDTISDFYPGEYQKNYIFTNESLMPEDIIAGMRKGNVWVVQGDLIDDLQFRIHNNNTSAEMGTKLQISGNSIKITIKVHDPAGSNYNIYSKYDHPVLDHIDLIAGYIYEHYHKEDIRYSTDTVNTTKIIARFDSLGNISDNKGLVSMKGSDKGNGYKEMSLTVNNVEKNMYFRLCGTNHKINTPNETDGEDNPLSDILMGENKITYPINIIGSYLNHIVRKLH